MTDDRRYRTPMTGLLVRPDKGLVARLQAEHRELLASLADLKRDLSGDASAALPGLRAFGARLLEHLALEDARLYPIIGLAAEGDGEVAGVFGTYLKDMVRLKEETHAFFREAAESGALDALQAQRFLLLALWIENRIQWEEELIYRIYDAVIVRFP